MGAVLEVDGAVFVEQVGTERPVVTQRIQSRKPAVRGQVEFLGRMENWRKVVSGHMGAGGTSQYCAGWAKAYVALRVSEAAPASEVADEKIKPLSPLVSAEVLDGWLVEAAWRMLGDYNERQALKALYVQRWSPCQIRRFLRGVRGPHVPLLIAKAEKNLQSILSKLGDAATIRSTTCLPGCPVPLAE
jgi:hypothetical protein